jgi:hypothetical protein
MTPEMQYVLLAFNVVFGIASFFGGVILKGIISDVRSLQAANIEFIRQLGTFATRSEVKADVNEVRSETRDALADIARAQSAGFEKVFAKLDLIQQQVANKADRAELKS